MYDYSIERNERMYKNKNVNENVEVYFICYKKEEMELVETYYDDILKIYYWYFNSYLAYKYWKIKFKGLKIGKELKDLLTIAASKYLNYCVINNEYTNNKDKKEKLTNLEKIQPDLTSIITKTNLNNLI